MSEHPSATHRGHAGHMRLHKARTDASLSMLNNPTHAICVCVVLSAKDHRLAPSVRASVSVMAVN